jgi:hypothetical protein
MIKTKGLWYAAALVGALVLGGYVGREYQKRAQTASAPERAFAPSAELEKLRAENQRLKSELASRSQGMPDRLSPSDTRATASAPLPDRLRVLADLQKRNMATASMSYVDRQGKLAPAFIELFALTPLEEVALQQSVDQARDRLAALERENATVARDPNGAMVISVKPFPEAGGAAYDQLVKSFAETLGPERNAAFLTLGVQQVERALAQFGAAQRTVTISEDVSPNGNIGYRVNENQKLGQGHSSSTSQFRSFQEAAKHLGTLERLLPPDFRAGR